MSTSKYKAFVAAAELGSLTRAADFLGYTQSGISHLINTLETELGFSLLIRSKAGTVLTPEGKEFLPYVRQLLDAKQNIENRASSIRGLASGTLHIGTFSSVAIHYLPGILKHFQDNYPQIQVSITNGTYLEIENALLKSDIDACFVTLPSREDFIVYPLLSDKLMAVVHSGSPLSTKDTLTLQDLSMETFLLPAEGSKYDIGKMFAKENFKPAKLLRINDDFAAVSMVQRLMGVTILPKLMILCFPPLPDVCAIPLQNSERQIGIAVHRARVTSPATAAFLSYIKSCPEI